MVWIMFHDLPKPTLGPPPRGRLDRNMDIPMSK